MWWQAAPDISGSGWKAGILKWMSHGGLERKPQQLGAEASEQISWLILKGYRVLAFVKTKWQKITGRCTGKRGWDGGRQGAGWRGRWVLAWGTGLTLSLPLRAWLCTRMSDRGFVLLEHGALRVILEVIDVFVFNWSLCVSVSVWVYVSVWMCVCVCECVRMCVCNYESSVTSNIYIFIFLNGKLYLLIVSFFLHFTPHTVRDAMQCPDAFAA